ncbi:MAG: diadenylate cyclase CdaA [Phycisphaeraceae bacterium]|nr:diadenylate cyclase CdaA [Phycisphaeraceae bacterium]
MYLSERIQSLLERLSTYEGWEVALEIGLIWILVFAIFRFVQGTRAAGALKGLLLLLILITVISRVLGGTGQFQRLGLLHDRFLALAAVGLIVIFQPELRRALVRLGETPFFRTTPKDIRFVVDQIADAADYLSRAKFGALIVVERQIGLAGLIEGGTVLNAELSSRLLQTIFFPGSALHDLAVVVRGRTIHSASVQLPLAEPSDMPQDSLGSRHRAAVGLSKECDALIVVVSEETGAIRIAERGVLSKRMKVEEFRAEFERRLAKPPLSTAKARQAAAEAPSVGEPQVPGEEPGEQLLHNSDVEHTARR